MHWEEKTEEFGMTHPLFCCRCKKEFMVREEDLDRVRTKTPGSFVKTDNGMRYTGGCFFKQAAALKREVKAATSGS